MQSDTTITKTFDEYLEWKRRTRLRRSLESGPLAPYFDDFINMLINSGYSWSTILEGVGYWRHLSQYAQTIGIREVSAFTDDLIEQHIAVRIELGTLLPTRRQLNKARRYTSLLLLFLRERGVAPQPAIVTEPQPPLLVDYLQFLEDHRGICGRVIESYRREVQAFLDMLDSTSSEQFKQLNASEVSSYVAKRAETLSRGGTKAMCSALRSFFRFLRLHGYLDQDLRHVVPVIPNFKLDRLPEPISEEDIERILEVVDRRTAKGKRDYAILRVLATYGLRTCQLCALRLDDIDWRQCKLRVPPGKGGSDLLVPLLPSVGEALIDYLRNGRPDWPFREIFLRVRAPKGPLRGSVGSNIITPYARKAGVELYGAHAWRHGCATRLLAKGFPLKTIRDLLGHQSVETTFIYTKVDIERLRCAALDWPGEL